MINVKKKLGRSGIEYLRYSSLAFMYWFAAATGTYTNIYLQKLGIGTIEVGNISALNSAMSIVAMPLWGMLSDKIRSIKKVFILAAIMSIILVPLIPLIGRVNIGPILMFNIIIPLSCFFRNPLNSLSDSWIVHAANKERLNYGSMRLWGSISFTVMSVLCTLILPKLGMEYSFYIYVVATLPLILVALSIEDDVKKAKSIPLREMHFGSLFSDYYYVVFLFFTVALNIPLNAANTFMPYLIENTGADSALMGLLSGYKAVIEVPILFLMVYMRKRFPMPAIIAAATLLHALEMLFYAVSGSFIHIMIVGTLQGVAQGLYIGIGANYAYGLAPENLKATALTVSSAMGGVAGILGNTIGGRMVEVIGVRNVFTVSGILLIGVLVLFALSFPFGKYILKKPMPEVALRPVRDIHGR